MQVKATVHLRFSVKKINNIWNDLCDKKNIFSLQTNSCLKDNKNFLLGFGIMVIYATTMVILQIFNHGFAAYKIYNFFLKYWIETINI